MKRNEVEFLDLLNIMSFVIGVLNYNENLTQGDKQDIIDGLDNATMTLMRKVEDHLESQDKKLDMIWRRIDGNK